MIGAEFDSLLVAARAGHEAAVGHLYRDLNPTLVRFLGAQAPGFREDLAQEVWVGAAKGIESFSGDESGFRAWMFTIARRQLISHWRQAGRRPDRVVDPAQLSEVRASPEHEPDAGFLADEAVRSLVSGLSREQAEIVLLRVVAGFDAEQVGVIVGKRAGTVRVLQHRALRRMAQRFAEEPVTK